MPVGHGGGPLPFLGDSVPPLRCRIWTMRPLLRRRERRHSFVGHSHAGF